MKIYLLKIYKYDPSSLDLVDVKCIACTSKDLAKRERLKHNFDLAIDNELVDEDHEGFDGWKMINFENYSYEIEKLEVVED
jgi:hypothetical protein